LSLSLVLLSTLSNFRLSSSLTEKSDTLAKPCRRHPRLSNSLFLASAPRKRKSKTHHKPPTAATKRRRDDDLNRLQPTRGMSIQVGILLACYFLSLYLLIFRNFRVLIAFYLCFFGSGLTERTETNNRRRQTMTEKKARRRRSTDPSATKKGVADDERWTRYR
ncbi:unnamed protein product, partial [Linum tenue]